MSNITKAIVFLIFFIFFVIITTAKVVGQTPTGIKPIPTTQSCGCIVYKGFKQTETSIKMGDAIVYADAIVFSFGETSKVFVKHSDEVVVDNKGKLYLTATDESGVVIIKAGKTLYYYTTKKQD